MLVSILYFRLLLKKESFSKFCGISRGQVIGPRESRGLCMGTHFPIRSFQRLFRPLHTVFRLDYRVKPSNLIRLFLATVVMLLFYHVFSTTDSKLPYSYKRFCDCGCADVLLREKKVDQLSLSRRRMDASGLDIKRIDPKRKRSTASCSCRLIYLTCLVASIKRIVRDLLSLRPSAGPSTLSYICNSIKWQRLCG